MNKTMLPNWETPLLSNSTLNLITNILDDKGVDYDVKSKGVYSYLLIKKMTRDEVNDLGIFIIEEV